MNSKNSVGFVVQFVEHSSTNTEAMGSNPNEAAHLH